MRGQMTHPDSGALAEFRAGLITGRRGARVAAHLAVCDRCAGVSDQLAEVSALLAAAPVPPVPDSLAQRLDTVLAAEVAHGNYPERAGADRPDGRVSGTRPTRQRRWRPLPARVLAVAGAAAALAAAGYGLSQVGGPTSSVAASSAAPASALAPRAAPARPGAAAAPLHAPASRPALNPAGKPAPYAVVTSGTYYQRATFGQQLERELLSPPGPARPPSPQIKGCVARVTDSSGLGVPVLVENAHFQGQPAIVIVASRDGTDKAWVARPGCSAAGDTVLYTQPGISSP